MFILHFLVSIIFISFLKISLAIIVFLQPIKISFVLALVIATFIRLQSFNKSPTSDWLLERTNDTIIQDLSFPYTNIKGRELCILYTNQHKIATVKPSGCALDITPYFHEILYISWHLSDFFSYFYGYFTHNANLLETQY